MSLVSGTLVATAGAGTAFAAEPVAGGLSAGDSLFPRQGNSGYDALHYDIDLTVDFAVSPTNNALATTTFRAATTTVTARTTDDPLSSYAFDFQGSVGDLDASTLNVDSVTVDGAPATFTRIENTTVNDATTDEHKLVVTPARPVSGEFTTVVKYHGTPVRHTDTDGSYEGWNNTTDGATFVNQPVGSMTAFPNNNTPRDKATYTITVDAPSRLGTSAQAATANPGLRDAAVVSNGELKSRTRSEDGTRTTWSWEQTKQMASELSLISVGRYDMYESDIALASGRTIKEWSFIDPAISVSNQNTTQATRAQLKQILDHLESRYGPYPGNSTGLVTDVVPSAINYALETQDRSFFPTSASRGTTIHEVMHQWFGDNVSPVDWNDIWLNEGPATYAEVQLPYEAAGSSTTSTESSYFTSWNGTNASSSLWKVPVAKMARADQLFGSPTYTRGAMTLEALRTAIGARDFAQVMEQWQSRFGGRSKTTADFIALAEEISGRDLAAFFDSWVYTTGKPAWPSKFDLSLTGPDAPAGADDTTSYTLTSRNTGRVPQTGSVVTVDLGDVLDDATLGELPAGTTVDGTTLTWTVPTTAVGATSTVSIPLTIASDATGATLKASARANTLGGTCVDCVSTLVVGAPPVAPSALPTVTGTPVVGEPLTAETAGWASGTTFTYQWLVDGSPVSGATKAGFTPDVTSAGLAVSVRVTGSKGSATPVTRTSEPTTAVARATQTGSVPTITGAPRIGAKLVAEVGSWEPGTFFTYQWATGGTNVSAANGGTGPTFTPSLAAQIGQTVTVTVTGTKGGFSSTARTSAATGAIATGAFGDVPRPTVSGTPRALAPVTADPGAWDTGTAFTYQWAVGGEDVSGATTAGFTPSLEQVGSPLTVTVTGTKAGYAEPASRTSEPVTIAPAEQTATPKPTIAGIAKVGVELTGDTGTWDEGVSLTYQWFVGDEAVEGATGLTYTPAASAAGERITFAVTGTKSGYAPATRTSEPTDEVVGGDLASTPAPTISGTAKIGAPLTAEAGEWDEGVTFSYQWLADDRPIEGATGRTYVPTVADLGAAIAVTVTGSKPGYEATTRTSEATGAVVEGDLVKAPRPTVSGSVAVGKKVTARAGTWDDGVKLSYQWLLNGTAIRGATSPTYTIRVGDRGRTLSVVVVGSRTGYTDAARISSGHRVALGTQAHRPRPAIKGTPKVGRTLTVKKATYDAGVKLSYKWYADGHRVGSNKPTLKLKKAYRGDRVTVRVVAKKTGYVTWGSTSKKTGKIAK
ncbi:M1 family aminopeptidase [Aeromicrobium chenweiae]|nr:M1 family aminopeptidase [Aeromicrobium chenweiae]